MEIWREIPWAAGYEVSTLGRIRSLSKTYTRRHWVTGERQSITTKDRILAGWIKPIRGKPSAQMVVLRINGRSVEDRVHRIVLGTFVGPCPPGMEGCHNDGDPLNNRLSNLRWDTHVNNMADAERHGTRSKPPAHYGEAHHNSTLTDAQVAEVRSAQLKWGDGYRLAEKLGVSYMTIYRIRRGQTRPSDDPRDQAAARRRSDSRRGRRT